MKFLVRVIGVSVLLVTYACQKGSRLTPHFLNESARQDLDNAKLVILAKVEAISDSIAHTGQTVIRPIEVRVSVLRTIKGRSAANAACIIYFFPYGAFDGQLPIWVQPGVTGFFSLNESAPCFRVVNDSRAVIRAYRIPDTPIKPWEKFVAEATLPQMCVGDAYSAASDVRTITTPLVGSRVARALLEAELSDPDSRVRLCTCEIMGLVWKLREACFESTATTDKGEIEKIERANDMLDRMEEEWLRSDPGAWLQATVSGYGMDGALIRLGGLMSGPGFRYSRKQLCSELGTAWKSGRVGSSLATGRPLSSEFAERSATHQFDEWLGSGCAIDPLVLERPLIGP